MVSGHFERQRNIPHCRSAGGQPAYNFAEKRLLLHPVFDIVEEFFGLVYRDAV